jgi:uncharacterized membrane protein
MNGFAHLLYLIDTNILELKRMQLLIYALIRFGDLTLIFGFIGLFLVISNHRIIKWLSLGFVVMGLTRFFLVEFSVIGALSMMSFVILIIQVLFLITFLYNIMKQNSSLMVHNGYLIIGLTFLYCLSILFAMMISNQPLALVESILAIFYIGFQVGLWMFFKQWYKELNISTNQL